MQSDTCKPGTSFSHVGSAHVLIDDEGNMADDDEEDPVVAEVCLFQVCEVNGTIHRTKSFIRHASF